MSFLTLDGVACAAPDGSPLFSNLSLALDRERIGLVGRNGAGKSTLLRTIAGELPVAAGTLSCSGRIGAIKQLPAAADMAIADALDVAPAFARLNRIERGQAHAEDLDMADWTLPARLEAALSASGLPGLDLARTIGTLSGGERMRVMLAAMLVPEPDVLLLDEPTNDLDAAGREAVLQMLHGWKGGAIVASHDRALLQHMDRIVELTPVGVHTVTGGWDAFDAQRKAEREDAEEALERSEVELGKVRRERQREAEKQARRDRQGRKFAARGSEPKMLLHANQQRSERTAARSRRVGGDLIAQAECGLENARQQVERLVPIRFAIPSCNLPSNHWLLRAEGLVCSRGGRVLFGPRDFAIRGPRRILLAGPNGSGKSSFIRLILGDDSPAAGSIIADRERIALLDQDLRLLDSRQTVGEAMTRHNPGLTIEEVHTALATYGFRNRWSQRQVASLSGGERMRLALACIFSGPSMPQLLVLDEPTNHLDIAATEMLESALKDYDGAVLCVSHDPAFAEALEPDECWDLGPGTQ